MQRIKLLLTMMLALLIVIACQHETPEEELPADQKAPLVETELEEDATLEDDIPVGEPALMDTVVDEESSPDAQLDEERLPASEASQETPPLPSGSTSDDSSE